MGLSASQARLITLTARMNDIEYQGQQINQQRTTLSSQVNALYDKLVSMSVPTPPSTSEYTRIEYSGAIGSDNFTIDSIRPQDSEYRVNLAFQTHGRFMEPTGTAPITKDENGDLYNGTNQVYTLTDAESGGVIDSDSIPGYLEAIRNKFPQYSSTTEYPDSDLKNMFYVYAVPNGSGLSDLHFIEGSTISEIPTGGEKWTTIYNFITNGTYTEIRTYDKVTLEFDSEGRITVINIPQYDDSIPPRLVGYSSYHVSAAKVTDNEAYEDAFNQYEYKKYLYDQEQQRINAQTSVIQLQDKNLELKLTRLDNERSAVKTEIDAVKKVVNDNIEGSYKSFAG